MEVDSPSSSQAFESKKIGDFAEEGEYSEGGRDIPKVGSISNPSNPTVGIDPSNAGTEFCSNLNHPCRSTDSGGRIIKKSKRIPRDVSGTSGSGSSSTSQQRGLRVTGRRKNLKVFIGGAGGGRRGESDVDALALPLGMSIAAVVAQVLDRKNVAGQRIPADHLSMICTSAVKESLANVFGNRFDYFVRNFEKSFGSTLRTLRMINEASLNEGGDSLSHSSLESHSSEVFQSTILDGHEHPLNNSGIKNCYSEAVPPTYGAQRPFSSFEEMQENMRPNSVNRELTLHGQINQQLACVSPSTLGSGFNKSKLSTFEKSVVEQARSNDLKTFEIGLAMKKLKLKEAQLALNSDSNHLERFKLSMGISKASFKAEKFKNQLEDTRHAELLKKCIDCLVAGLLIMSAALVYGAYVYSYKRITEVTASCTSPPKESKSWWIPKPVASINSGMHTLRCQIEVVSRMLFGVFMILAIAYLLLQRSAAASTQMMPVTLILMLLGVVCGFAGKLCVDTLGGSGYHWLLYWEALCLLHFFANVCTSVLFSILHGPISVSQGAEAKARLPYWIRRLAFYAIMLLFLPLFCGLMPFAGPTDWKDHISSLATDALSGLIIARS